MKLFIETLVLVLFVGSFAVGYATQTPWHEQAGLSMFVTALLFSFLNIVIPSPAKAARHELPGSRESDGGRDRI